jgi:hypothetical protein
MVRRNLQSGNRQKAPTFSLAGYSLQPLSRIQYSQDPDSVQNHLAIARLLMDDSVEEPVPGVLLSPLSEEVVSCNFWLLAAREWGAFAHQAWYAVDRQTKTNRCRHQSWLDNPAREKISQKKRILRSAKIFTKSGQDLSSTPNPHYF